MTVQQADQILGKPLDVIDMPPTVVPNAQIRQYKGDGNHSIFIHFKKGVAEDIEESIPRTKWLPVG
jgi:hypothetical protein